MATTTFRGELIAPGDPTYDEARAIWNGAIDRRPALIARCRDAHDVVDALKLARERELQVSVRGGGHGVGGHAIREDGLVVDLSPMRGIAVDADHRIARAQGGVLWGEFDQATQAHGLSTTGGIVTHTGIAGLTLGGGIGWLMRRCGATVDNLLGAELVTPDGAIVTADEDLLWGLRGGGGNFGVVTEFEYRLHEIGPTVLAGPLYYALEDGPEVLRHYRDFIATAPDELTTILNLRQAPPLPILPPELHGKPVVTIIACWAGDPADGERELEPLRRFGTPVVDLLTPRPYTQLQGLFDPALPHGWHYYWKSWETPPLTDATIDIIVEQTERITTPRSYIIVFQLGGAMARVGEHDTAFGQREEGHDVNINAVWLADDDDGERHVEWTRETYAKLEPHGVGRAYVNFLGEEGADRVRAAYGPEKYARLQALKRQYDPANVLRGNQNVVP
jgi:FAD/FMN-containing dehydrogenase